MVFLTALAKTIPPCQGSRSFPSAQHWWGCTWSAAPSSGSPSAWHGHAGVHTTEGHQDDEGIGTSMRRGWVNCSCSSRRRGGPGGSHQCLSIPEGRVHRGWSQAFVSGAQSQWAKHQETLWYCAGDRASAQAAQRLWILLLGAIQKLWCWIPCSRCPCWSTVGTRLTQMSLLILAGLQCCDYVYVEEWYKERQILQI